MLLNQDEIKKSVDRFFNIFHIHCVSSSSELFDIFIMLCFFRVSFLQVFYFFNVFDEETSLRKNTPSIPPFLRQDMNI